jgi:hypothetical protein
MSSRQDKSERIDQPLKNASSDRLACLLRHWTWADEAMAIDSDQHLQWSIVAAVGAKINRDEFWRGHHEILAIIRWAVCKPASRSHVGAGNEPLVFGQDP